MHREARGKGPALPSLLSSEGHQSQSSAATSAENVPQLQKLPSALSSSSIPPLRRTHYALLIMWSEGGAGTPLPQFTQGQQAVKGQAGVPPRQQVPAPYSTPVPCGSLVPSSQHFTWPLSLLPPFLSLGIELSHSPMGIHV